jgi:hypothetical protein
MTEQDRATGRQENADEAPAQKPPTGNRRLFITAVLAVIVLALAGAVAVIIFNGNDRPQSKIDYSGMYAGEDPSDSFPVPGHPEMYTRKVDATFENGTAIDITENRTAADPSYDRLIDFLDSTRISREPYQSGHVCSSFAAELHDAAEYAGIRAHVVVIFFADAPQHMIVAFKTTDRDIVYADATGRTRYEINAGYPPTYRIAEVVPGQAYVRHYPAPFEDFKEYISMGNVSSVKFLA